MLEKPHECQSCPAYERGAYWVPDKLVDGSEVLILLQNPGEYEERGERVTARVGKNQYTKEHVPPQPLIGPTGYDCDQTWFPLGGLTRAHLSLANTIRCRFNESNELPLATSALCREVRDYCQSKHCTTPTGTRLIVACGAHAAAAMGCPGSVTDWRGHILPNTNPPVFVTLHPADLNHQPRMGVACVKDWKKIPRILAGEWPSPLPPIQYYTGGERDYQWFSRAMTGTTVSIDTEYDFGAPGSIPRLTLLGLSSPVIPQTLSVWWDGRINQTSLSKQYGELVRKVPVVFWNATADIPVIEAALGVGYHDYYRIEDPMLKHALLWSELPHTLEFCASCDGKYPKLKHLMSVDLALYNQGDVLETLHLNEVYDEELSQDPQTQYVYETQALPLIPVLLRSQRAGVRVDQVATCTAIREHRDILDRSTARARQASGMDINLGSSHQVQDYLYTHKGYQVQKHFKTKRPTVNQDAINVLRATFVPVDAEYEEQEGLTDAYIQGRLGEGADPFLESVALFSSVRSVLHSTLYGLLATVYVEQDEARRKRIRRDYTRMDIGPSDIVQRVFPNYKQHTQANGRWSITDPNLPGTPKSLHHLYIPDPGDVWIKYDFKQIEPRIRACLSHDTPRLRDFQAGKDIYQSTCLEMFGRYSPTLRKLGKTVELALSYGKKPENMHHVPGIMGYGFQRKDLIDAAYNYLRAHPDQTRWMESHIRQIHTIGYSRDPVGGRKRNLLGHWSNQEREGLNQPMQAGAASLTNLIILRIHREVPDIRLVNNRFDEHWWAIPRGQLESARTTIKQILSQPQTIAGITMHFPVDPPNLLVIYSPEGV